MGLSDSVNKTEDFFRFSIVACDIGPVETPEQSVRRRA